MVVALLAGVVKKPRPWLLAGLRYMFALLPLVVYVARAKWFHWHRVIVVAPCPHFYSVVPLLLAVPPLVWFEKAPQAAV